MGRLRYLVVGLFFAVVLAGCGAARAYKQGLVLEAEGKVVAASARYLDALDKKSSHEEARAALAEVAEEAWERQAAPVPEPARCPPPSRLPAPVRPGGKGRGDEGCDRRSGVHPGGKGLRRG
ncbi:MAG: hypothetical protein JRI25_21235 [Deltaproteobacteria bacterium]|nr:hypothetical protein [Deltaproteobacteria bacterium]